MHSIQTGLWDPQPPSKHALPIPAPPPSSLHNSHVISTTPAKRITFYKSGDSQFGGVRMAIHKRSFKCFDALLDDLSQKVPLPFGVRTVTTPRGTHTIKHLEQLQDGGCYLCSDRRQAKPINMELASKHQGIWYHHSWKPQRPETSSATPSGHLHFPYRQRRILLVKNSEPSVRRSIVLSRRSTRSLKAFLDEVSEVMQFHIRKLYTAEGRRIDSVQSLMTCPGVLVCVGREAFSPMLINYIRKTSEEKLPGLTSKSAGLGPRIPGNGARSPATNGIRSSPHGAQSRASEYDERHESKKNINFGLETKKSVIHPRSDSSNRSTRFSLSSEKSYGTCSQARPAIMNDDIEKRVLVNKDGSVSLEMRVRFRLQNDENIHWSTQIKKSPSLTNDCCSLSQAQPHYLQQGQSETCSDPDSTSYEGVDYSSQQCALEENRCPCCYQRQDNQFDLWENPMNKHPPVPPARTTNHTIMRHSHSSSSSSSCNTRRVVQCRARLSRSPGGSGSEQSQLVQKEMCMTEQVERRVEVDQDGDTQVEVCKVSRCCSRTEVVAMDNNLQLPSRQSAEGELMMGEEENRPLSTVSSSSHILQSLKEDQDDDEEEDDLPPSASQCSHRNEPSPSPTHMDEEPSSILSTNSVHSVKSHKEKDETGNGVLSASCHCRAATPHSTAEADETDRVPTSRSNTSKPKSEEEGAAETEEGEINRTVSGLSHHTGRPASSQRSWTSNVCSHCGGWKAGVNSNRSEQSLRASPHSISPLPNQENGGNHCDDVALTMPTHLKKISPTRPVESNTLEDRTSSAMSATSNPDTKGKGEGRASSTVSATSHRSNKSNCGGISNVTSAQSNLSAKSRKSKCTTEDLAINSRKGGEEEASAERTASSLSDKSGASIVSQRSNCLLGTKEIVDEGDTEKRAPSTLSVRSNASATSGKAESIISTKSKVSATSGTSHRSASNQSAKALSNKPSEGGKVEERSTTAMSAMSNLSAKSNKSHYSTKAPEQPPSPRPETKEDVEERATSQTSEHLSVVSTKSSKYKDDRKATSPNLQVEDNADESIEAETEPRPNSINNNSENGKRAASAMSGKSTKSHHTNTEVDRPLSATSRRSDVSQRSNHSKKSSNPQDTDAALIETNGDEKEKDNREDCECAVSVKSNYSVKSAVSRKSNSSRKISSPNVAKTPEGADEENDTKKEDPSDASEISNHNGTTDIAVNETAEKGEHVDNGARESSEDSHDQTLSPNRTPSPRTHPRKTPAASRQLLPNPCGGEARGSSALSVHSTASSKFSRSRCCCGSASALEKEKNIKQGENEEDDKSDGASEQAVNIRSSSSKRQRKESGVTEPTLSRNSSGSISLGLPEDQETAGSDSGKSSVFCIKAEGEVAGSGEVSKSSENVSVREDIEKTGSTVSHGKKTFASSHNPPAGDIPTIKTPEGGEDGGEAEGEQISERAASASTVKSSKSRKSCGCSVKTAAQLLDSKSKKRSASSSPSRVPNADEMESVKSASTTNTDKMDTLRNKTSSAVSGRVRRKSPSKASVKNPNAAKETASVLAKTDNREISRPASETKEMEDVPQNTTPRSQSPRSPRPESVTSTQSESKIASKQSQVTPGSVKGHKTKSQTGSQVGSIKAPSSRKETSIKSSSPCPLHNPKSGSKIEASSESPLSHSLSAADLLKETMAAVHPHSQKSKTSKTSDKPTSEKNRRSQKTSNLMDQEDVVELRPECLPNASPNEVISDWLRSIPANSSMLTLDNELNEDREDQKAEELEEKPEGEAEQEQVSPEEELVEHEQKSGPPEEEEEKEDEAECDTAGPTLGDSVETPPSVKNWQCSAAVMKVLLSSSFGRCRSMPEVSPVYGRRLSTSARGLLDCLAQLQVIEPAVGCISHQQKDRKQQYDEIMDVLQSLWLTEPRNTEDKETKDNKGSVQVTPPTSSSGVGMSSGSDGSGKGNGNQGEDETHAKETESVHEEETVEKVLEEDGDGNDRDEDTEMEPEEMCKADVDEVQVKSEEQTDVPQSLESPKATKNPLTSNKSSANDSSKSPTDNERETQEDSRPSTPPPASRAPLSKRLSQDPDPVWVLNLLKKLEKQFMSHYIEAMAEFKVRWDLDDSLILDTMVTELRDEVSRRIQNSIQCEMKKIQSRAGKVGRSPRPPGLASISRDSTMTERRRRMLKVMKNQSVRTGDSVSDDEMTGSDQRSDDEYCPCEACVRKKMATRPFKKNPLAAEAPVMMEFDLRKILQLKKSPSPATVTASQPAEVEGERTAADEEGRNLEVLEEEEEEEETKQDIKAEGTTPEESEVVEQEKDNIEEENSVENEELEEEEIEEDQKECTCHSGKDEEENSKDEGEEPEETNTGDEEETGDDEKEGNEGETVTGEEEEEEEEEEESDKETVKEATAGKKEKESEDDSFGDAANESTLVEEVVEGTGVEGEDEDDEDNGTGDSHKEEKAEESGEEEGQASEEEKCSPQSEVPPVSGTEGEEADAEDSDDSKHEESGHEEVDGSGDEEETESGDVNDEVEEDVAEEFKPESEEEEEEATGDQNDDGTLLHQFTRSSVESQPGSMEDAVDADSPSNPPVSGEAQKVADGASAGGSQSSATTKRPKAKEK